MSAPPTTPNPVLPVSDAQRRAAYRSLLVDSGLATPEQVQLAQVAKSHGAGHLDEFLVGQGMVDDVELLRVTARAWNLTAVRLDAEVIDEEFVRQWSGQQYLAQSWMPLRRDSDGTVVIATAREPHPEMAASAARQVLGRLRFVAVTSWDLRNTTLRIFRTAIADEAANELWKQNPRLSVRTVFSRGQLVTIAIAVAVSIVAAVLAPIPFAVVCITIAGLVFLGATGFKFLIALRGARFDVVQRIGDRQVANLTDAELPKYTVLVPVFREANIVAQLVGNLGGLDYPAEKLEVLILTEEEDQETRDAIAAANPPTNFRVLTVPRGHPQTKPRACNVGLFFATGEFLVIYDAEDRPDPDQLKKAVIAFRRGGERMVCVQAALNYFNAEENVLTRMFTLEYSYWFDYMLPGLEVSRLPIPLGGTSNHFRTRALIELGGWDPYNVTEDADLGIRASALGYRVGVINSTTMEEANTSIPNFVRQRSRWIKGYMQTSLVHARTPLSLLRKMGPKAFGGFVLLIAGTPLVFLGVLPFYAITLVTLIAGPELISPLFPLLTLWVSLISFLLGNGVTVYLSMMGPFKRGTFRLVAWSLLNPVYWLLHSVAAYKALWQLLTKPHYWEKTEHGLTAHTAD